MAELKVKCPSAFVPDYAAAEASHNRFVGRELRAPWALTDAVVTLPVRHEYIEHLRAGELVPADAETAKLAGVAFGKPEKSEKV